MALNRAIPLRDQVYSLVRKAIVTGKLAPGAPINEIDIATRLGISRTPVREAVKKVSDEGLVEVFAQHGTFVADIRREQVEEAYIIRIALELESIRRAAERITPSHVQDLEDIVNAHETAVKRSRYDEAIARDDDFHRYIAEVNGLQAIPSVCVVVVAGICMSPAIVVVLVESAAQVSRVGIANGFVGILGECSWDHECSELHEVVQSDRCVLHFVLSS